MCRERFTTELGRANQALLRRIELFDKHRASGGAQSCGTQTESGEGGSEEGVDAGELERHYRYVAELLGALAAKEEVKKAAGELCREAEEYLSHCSGGEAAAARV